MRIAIVLQHFYGQIIGGAEFQAFLIAKDLVKQGHEVHYIFVSTGENYSNEIGVILHEIKKNRYVEMFGLEIPCYYSKIDKILQEIKPHSIYVRGRSALTIVGVLLGKKNKVKTVWHIANDHDLLKKRVSILSKQVFRIPQDYIFHKITKKPNRIIAQTNHQAKKLLENYGRECEVVPNGHPLPDVLSIQPQSEKIVIIWIGSLKPRKQPDVFVNLSRFFRDNNNVSFLMLGRNNIPKKTFDIMTEVDKVRNLEWLGEVSNHEVNNFLSKSAVLVNTSREEGFPNIFIQAWMRSIPVVSLNIDPDDVIKRFELGFHSREFRQLVIDLKNLIDDHCLRERFGRIAHEFASREYSMENIHKTVEIIVSP